VGVAKVVPVVRQAAALDHAEAAETWCPAPLAVVPRRGAQRRGGGLQDASEQFLLADGLAQRGPEHHLVRVLAPHQLPHAPGPLLVGEGVVAGVRQAAVGPEAVELVEELAGVHRGVGDPEGEAGGSRSRRQGLGHPLPAGVHRRVPPVSRAPGFLSVLPAGASGDAAEESQPVWDPAAAVGRRRRRSRGLLGCRLLILLLVEEDTLLRGGLALGGAHVAAAGEGVVVECPVVVDVGQGDHRPPLRRRRRGQHQQRVCLLQASFSQCVQCLARSRRPGGADELGVWVHLVGQPLAEHGLLAARAAPPAAEVLLGQD
jgi:hypothetical protein